MYGSDDPRRNPSSPYARPDLPQPTTRQPAAPPGTQPGPYAPQQPQPQSPPPPRSKVDAGRLWMGGAMAAVVAALTAVVAVLLVRGVLDVAVFAPEGEGAFGDASTGALAIGAAGAALAATLLMHILLLAAPQPGRFFTWIVGLATAVMVLLPFTTDAELSAKIGSAAVYLAIGIAIGSLVSASGRSALRTAR
ncbi:DUF6069 family protein [Yinghuangia soli]|uniref:DUF6069 family protein n=1 Tax=Yinghuangia soli TaxID=2908204 RepID=A0AA41Q609_9ACTN|nr:DUF6069 family protein [Yinghuangia soli]MCF2532218.1 DUF6069 family protein [Yinghuangia soli]